MKKVKLSNLTHINANTLPMDVAYILSLISSLNEENSASCRSHFQPK